MGKAQVALVTDSTASLTAEECERMDATVVQLYIILDGEQRRENEITDMPAFYKAVLDSPQLTTTSQPSIGDFMAAYEPLLAEGRDIVSVHLSGGVSGTVEAARQAAKTLEDQGKGGERIHVADSRTTAGALAMVCLAASNEIARGSSAEQVVARVEAARDETHNWILLDTLEFLQKGGRIGSAQALIGNALRIKPIIAMEQTVRPIEKVRTWSRGVDRIKAIADEQAEKCEMTWVAQHIQKPDRVEDLAAHCRQTFGNDGSFISELSPVLGCYAGPGLIALGTVPTALVE